jgi:hypothetical protein
VFGPGGAGVDAQPAKPDHDVALMVDNRASTSNRAIRSSAVTTPRPSSATWAEEGYSISQLLTNRDKLLKIFGEHTQTDESLDTVSGVIGLFDVFVNAYAHTTLRSVPFPQYLGPCSNGPAPCLVYADPGAEEQTYQQFLMPTPRTPTSITPTIPARQMLAIAGSLVR